MQTITISRSPLELPAPILRVLPAHLCDAIRRCGAPRIEEIRLHSERFATVSVGRHNYKTGVLLSQQDMQQILHRMCGGSLYAFSQSICQGYLAMPEGIRVGVAGTAAIEEGRIIGVSSVSGLILRVPHRVEVDPAPILKCLFQASAPSGVLIYAPAGVGKTTLLRSVARHAASHAIGLRTAVVDSREELHFTLDGADLLLDILVGYPRQNGIEIATRTLGAQLIVCDEIGNAEDADAILFAANCGVPLIASAHAGSLLELLRRHAIARLHFARVFGSYVGLWREDGKLLFEIHTWEEADRLIASQQRGERCRG